MKLIMGSPFGSDTTSAVGADRLLFTSACHAAVWALVSLSRFFLSELAKVYSLGLYLARDVIFLQHGVGSGCCTLLIVTHTLIFPVSGV